MENTESTKKSHGHDYSVFTTIPSDKTTRERLKAVGMKGETYSDIINRVLDVYEKNTGV